MKNIYAIAKVQKTTLAIFIAQLVDQCGGKAAFGGAQGIGVPAGASRSFPRPQKWVHHPW